MSLEVIIESLFVYIIHVVSMKSLWSERPNYVV